MNILIFLIILLVLVLVHEFGHFFTAKKFGIRVDEFGFGFPPKIAGIKKGETEYSLNALPFGGFVKIFGENGEDSVKVEPSQNTHREGSTFTDVDASRSFVNRPKWQQAIVLFAGVFMNFILAWILFSVGFMSGLPTSVGNEAKGQVLENVNLTVVSVLETSPAFMAGLKSGDKIVSVQSGQDSLSKIDPETLKSFIVAHPDKEIEVGYERGNNIQVAKVTPIQNTEQDKPMIGISMDMIGTAKLPFLTAFKEGMTLTLFVTKGTAVGLYTLISEAVRGQGSLDSVTGIVGMVGMTGDAYEFGFVYLLSFTALISVNLAIINLVPIPALDGGRLLFLLIEKIKGSRLNSKFTNTANAVGFGALIILMLVITYHDVVKLF
ncbi:RIP metalloprotease RseP [Candidatus Nomurabacteria bacterium]|nr:RIP metalloprotease RseP [Candidatus Nomurabacteria bacterium]